MTEQELLRLSLRIDLPFYELKRLHDSLMPQDQLEAVIRTLLKYFCNDIRLAIKFVERSNGQSMYNTLRPIMHYSERDIARDNFNMEFANLFWNTFKWLFKLFGLKLKDKYRRDLSLDKS